MAITGALAKVTEHSFSVLLTQDGAAGTTLTLTNAVMQAYFTGAGITTGSPLLRLLQTAQATTALARTRMLGDASGHTTQDLRAIDHAKASLEARTLVGAGWFVDADTDAVSVTLPELNLTGPAGASTCLLTVEFQHSLVR